MRQQVHVRIFRGEILIDEVERPLRVVGQIQAVKFHRKFWPLLQGDIIDISGPSLSEQSSSIEPATTDCERESAVSGDPIMSFIAQVQRQLD
jgi:hypothetical protein